MRVLWFTNNPCKYESLDRRSGYNGGGWMTALQEKITEVADIDLGICFIYTGVYEKEVQKGVYYYHFPHPKKSIRERIYETIHINNVTLEEPRWQYYINNFSRVINDFKPDVIHVFGSELYMGLVTFATDRPLVLHIQGILNTCYDALYGAGISRRDFIFQDYNPINILKRYKDDIWWRRNCYRERVCLKHIKHFIGRTEWDKRVISILSPNSIYHIGEEIMRGPFYRPKRRALPQKLIINSVISAASYKGFDLILKIADILKNKMQLTFEWNVYGNVDPSFAIHETRLHPSSLNVRLNGVVTAEQLRDIHSEGTVYYHSSYIENGCNAIIEAQMCGCTPIANYVGGLSTTIQDGNTGYLVPANDKYQAAYLIKWLYEHPKENLEIGANAAKEAFYRHNEQQIMDDLIEIYKKIIIDAK